MSARGSRLWGKLRDLFGGFAQFVTGIFTGDMGAALDGLKRAWDGLSGYYQTLWDGISGIFRWAWEGSIKPVLDGLFGAVGLGAVWDGVKTAIGAVLDWLSAKFAEVWAIISPVIDGLIWVKDRGAAALSAIGIGSAGTALTAPEIAAVADGSTLHLPPRAPIPATRHDAAIDKLFGPVPGRARGAAASPPACCWSANAGRNCAMKARAVSSPITTPCAGWSICRPAPPPLPAWSWARMPRRQWPARWPRRWPSRAGGRSAMSRTIIS